MEYNDYFNFEYCRKYLDIKNIFKIIANNRVKENDLIKFFGSEIVELSKNELNNIKFKNEFENLNKIYCNYSIVFYTDKTDIIYKQINLNIFNLTDEYEESHRITNKYNKLQNYLDKSPLKKNLFIKCNLEYAYKKYYSSIPFILVDKKYELLEILKKLL